MARIYTHSAALLDQVRTRGSLGNALGKIASTKLVVGGLSLINQILLVRLFQESLFGLYVLLLSVLAFFSLGTNVFESGIARFWPGAGLTSRVRLASAVLFFKLVILLLTPVIPLFSTSLITLLNIDPIYQAECLAFFAVAPLYLCAISILTFVSTALGALLLYRDLAIVGIVQALGTTLILMLTYLSESHSLARYFFFLTLVLFASALTGVVLFSRRHKLLACVIIRRTWGSDFPSIFSRYLKRYSLPLIATSLFGYVKNNTANLVVGSRIDVETLGAFAAFRQISAIPHKAFDSLIERLFPHLFKLADTAKAEFREQTRRLEAGTRWVRASLCVLLLAAFPAICLLYGLPFKLSYFILHAIFLANLYFSYRFTLAKISFYRLKTTTPIAAGAAVRAVVTAAATIVLTETLGAYGAALSILVGTILTAHMLTEIARRMNEEDASR